MPILSGIAGFFDKYVLGYALGTAAGPSLEPFVQDLANSAWELNQVLPPEAFILAQGVAQGQVSKDEALTWAHQQGYSDTAFNALVDIANVGPGMAQAYNLYWRGELDEAGFRRALLRLGIEQEWIDDLWNARDTLLTPAELAVMVQRTIVSNDDLLPNQPSTAGSNVPPMPGISIDPVAEAAKHGLSRERLAGLARIIGLPASPDLAARMHFRNIITEGAFNQAILEGNTRGEWAPFLLDGFRQILTANEYQEAALRGVLTQAQADAKTAQHGMSAEDTATLFQILGRPLNVHAITTGLARGGKFGGTYADVPEPYQDAIRRSNIRPEYAVLAYANRYNYPSAFVLRSLAQAGELGDAAAVEKILLDIAWPPDLAAKVAPLWVGGGTGVDANVKKAQTKAWTEAQASYIAEESTAADVQPIFTLLGIDAAGAQQILQTWDAIRALTRKQLSPAQIRKALGDGITNPATGVAWTTADATAALLARGYDAADAQVFLEE